MIDTHCHLTFDVLYEQVAKVIAEAERAGVTQMISVGTQPSDCRRALRLASRHDNVFTTAGLHPHYVEQERDHVELVEGLRSLAEQDRVVALGEMGLDYYYDDPPREMQRQALRWQLETAAEIDDPDLPIVIHNRDATDDVLAMLKGSGIPGERFVFHCFTGTSEEVEKILDFGAMVGFTGIVTFANAKGVAEASDRVPMDRLLVETDSPFLTPEPHRKVRPNQPKYVVEVAKFLAERRGMSYDVLAGQVDANARRVFRLPPG
ncbi:MAG: TatD family hydrolase [Phycisphaeraceae bacterium]